MSDISSQYFKYFLTETATGLAYHEDFMGQIKTDSVLDGVDYSLPEHPDGWLDFVITYARNAIYCGINRSFTVPLNFIGVGARIIRKLFYTGRGIEQPLTLVILKWDEDKGFFDLYYSGQLDLSQNNNTVATSVVVNIMEGGILQLFKSYENTVVEIPCDGSIPENIKVLADGIEFADTFHYQILKLSSPFPGVQPLPMTYISNDGDNIGVVHGDQNLEQPYTNYTAKSSNFAYSNISPSKARIKGSISIKSDPGNINTVFYLYAVTSLAQPRAGGGTDHAVGLVKSQNPYPLNPNGFFIPSLSQVFINGQMTYFFDEVITLDANENLFIFFFNQFAPDGSITILGGSVAISFNSKLPNSRVWGITCYDVWRLIGQKLNALASTTDYPFNFAFTSNLLQEHLNFIITSGDAIRASTDPNYFQYYNLQTLNPQNPNNTDYTQFSSLGPVIKINVSDFFKFINTILYAAIGNQKDINGKDSIFIEARQYVLDPSVVTYACPDQVNNLSISVGLDYYFNWLRVGYPDNQYDEKSGKYEYNNTNEYQPPIKTLAKTFEILSPIRTDSYGFEFTRYNPQGGKSTTFNNSDSSKWGLDIDFSSFILDYYEASFVSSIQNTTSTANTNQHLLHGMNYQPVLMPVLDGEYFINGIDFSIFMFNQNVSVSRVITAQFTALLNGLAGDTATIKFWRNGVVIQQWTQAITGVNTVFNETYTASFLCALGDNLYFTVDLLRTCTITINTFSLNVGGGYFICQLGGPLSLNAGATQQLISLPVITANTVVVNGNTIQVVSYGFQYFRFLSNVQNRTFNWDGVIQAFIKGNPSQTVTFTLWKNGIKIGEIPYNGTSVQSTINSTGTPQFSGTDFETNYDTYWFTASCQDVDCWIYAASLLFESTSIRAYRFLREAYSNVSGIPNPDTAFNFRYSPARIIQRWKSYLASCLSMIGSGTLMFQTASKNAFLSTTLNGITITENASIDIHDFGQPDFLPLIFTFDTSVKETAKKLFDYAANGYVSFPYKNKIFYGFPLEISIKPAMNDVQTWKLLASPQNNLNDLVDLDWDGIISLQFLDVMIPYICPLHFVSLNFTKDARFNTYTMDEDWFVNRVKGYMNQSNYFAPWQNNDIISLQCQTNGLGPVTVEIYKSNGQSTGTIINIPQVSASAILSPQTLYQGDISLTALPQGKYYFVWRMGTGAAQAQFISEGIHVKKLWVNTQLHQYSNSRNKLAVIFNSDVPYRPSIRLRSKIVNYVPKSKFTTFVNEPQDIKLQNAIPYDTWTLQIAFDEGIPDYMSRKIERIYSLDTVFNDGNQYTRDADAEVDIQATKGTPKVYATLIIRKAFNGDGLTVNTANQLEGPQQAGYVLNAQAFGQNNNDQQLVNVTKS